MIRIKLEVDTNPPAGGTFETRYLDFPFPQATVAHDPPSLFAGKLHAVLCRRYLKGRDWYDFVRYTVRRTPVNYRLLARPASRSSHRVAHPFERRDESSAQNWNCCW